jgi:hypothetical protein
MTPFAARFAGRQATLLLAPVAVSLLAARLAFAQETGSGARLVIAASAIVLVVSAAFLAPRNALFGLIVWLAALGSVRRLVSLYSPAGTIDTLLLVAPAGMAVLLLFAHAHGAFTNRTRLANLVLALGAMSLVSVINPLQGSPLTGIAGLVLFLFVPSWGFWIARAFCDDRTMASVLKLVAVLGIPAALYGFVQVFNGFPHWDAAWIKTNGYTALNVGTVTRPFSAFASSTEYALFIATAVIVWLAFGRTAGRLPITLAAVALLAVAAFYISTRGVVFLLAASVAIMFAALLRLPSVVAAALGAAAILAVPSITARLTAGPLGYSPLVAHQVEGLAHPLGQNSSTLNSHISLLRLGLSSARAEPLGRGVGAVNQSASKLGGLEFNTEADPSNVAVALGVPGLLAYLLLVVLALWRAYVLAKIRRDPLSLAALGILVLSSLQWLNGGHYSIVFIIWLVLGWLDRASLAPAPEATARTEEPEDARPLALARA